MKDARDRVSKGGEAVFEGYGGANKAAGKDAILHDAHTRAGDDALPHLHPVDAKGKKKSGHAFFRTASQKIFIPGATAGVSLFGDNLLGETAAFFNPLGDVQDVSEAMETLVIPTLFGAADYLIRSPTQPESQDEDITPEGPTERQVCAQSEECSPTR